MSRASQQVAQEIVDALQVRISEWEAERGRIDVIRSRQDRKEERYNILGELIAEAQKEIANAGTRLPAEDIGVRR